MTLIRLLHIYLHLHHQRKQAVKIVYFRNFSLCRHTIPVTPRYPVPVQIDPSSDSNKYHTSSTSTSEKKGRRRMEGGVLTSGVSWLEVDQRRGVPMNKARLCWIKKGSDLWVPFSSSPVTSSLFIVPSTSCMPQSRGAQFYMKIYLAEFGS